jgi:type IV secretion system protein VirB9
MVAVTWDVPQGIGLPIETRPAGAVLPSPPAVDVTRLHTAYVVEPVKGKPPWLPLAVYDDGSKTVIRFRESLRYTNAPAVFVRHADGSPGVVEFTPYDVPDAPEKGAYYVVQGLWPQVELRGSEGQVVRITRTTGQAARYRAQP